MTEVNMDVKKSGLPINLIAYTFSPRRMVFPFFPLYLGYACSACLQFVCILFYIRSNLFVVIA